MTRAWQLTDVRHDRVLWLSEEDADPCISRSPSESGEVGGSKAKRSRTLNSINHQPQSPAIARAISMLKGCAHDLNKQLGLELKVPRQAMATCYPGVGAHYKAHRDNAPQQTKTTSEEAGVAQWRQVTAVVYINGMDWDVLQHGGCLRCYVGAKSDDHDGRSCPEYVDVAPRGGRLVVFWSAELLHEVLPTKGQDRYAITLWMMNTISTGTCPDTNAK
mmetsp:Transcript_37502/g.70381  ORF Transcript_37502/g.70381 Transcript_37502/m.70381 type:complete len:218 (+) Transcript_37502:24-677(+)